MYVLVMKDTVNKSERFEMRMSAEELYALDKLRRAEDDLPPRAEMIRRLIIRASDKGKVRR